MTITSLTPSVSTSSLPTCMVVHLKCTPVRSWRRKWGSSTGASRTPNLKCFVRTSTPFETVEWIVNEALLPVSAPPSFSLTGSSLSFWIWSWLLLLSGLCDCEWGGVKVRWVEEERALVHLPTWTTRWGNWGSTWYDSHREAELPSWLKFATVSCW